MKRSLSVVLGVALLAAVPATAHAAPAENNPETAPRAHDLPSPLAEKQSQERQAGLEAVLSGTATPSGANQVVKLGRGKYVELAREDTDRIWTVLGQFSDLPHNKIPQPDRKVDNTTIWTKDFSQPYFQNLLFNSAAGVNSMANFYEEQSSGRYSVEGGVEDWTTVPGTGADYGSNDKGDEAAWDYVDDSVDAWYAKQVAGKSPAEVKAYLATFDQWDRYDYDGDGNFDEPDGYIDHFQAVHSGQGEEVGGGALGDDAIWSHRWYVNYTDQGVTGPTVNGKPVLLGGTEIGDSGLYIGDYTVEPENGGVGVFSHEFGHDLGLPDLYDTSGNSGGAENSTAFWTLMSSGSYGNSGRPEDGIGTKPIPMGAWEKIQLNWIDPKVVDYGKKAVVQLGPSAYNTKQEEAILAVLPDIQVTSTIGTSYDADGKFWYSGQGNNLNNTMLTPYAGGAQTLSAQLKYETEEGYDYAYAGYVAPGSASFTPIPTNLAPATPYAISGSSGGKWVQLTADLSKVPANSQVGFRYQTDGGVAESGVQVDAVTIGTTPITNWTLKGFTLTTGTTTTPYFNAYVAENRAYTGYDAGLKTSPYNFGDKTKPDWAERFPYQDGLLVSYWNTQYSDNNVGDHPGAGQVLPVDAHSALLYEPTDDEKDAVKGESWRARVQSYDSTFGWQPTDRITLHDPDSGVAKQYGGLPPVPVFDDRKDWYVAPNEQPDSVGWTGVNVPRTGTKISVLVQNPVNNIMTVKVN